MNGSIVICDDDKVVSTINRSFFQSSVEESKSLYKNEFRHGGRKLSAFIQRPETGMDARRRLKTMMHISFSGKPGLHHTKYCMCDVCVTCLTSFLSLLGEQEQNRKEKYPSRSEETSCDQCTWPCIFFYFSCEYKNRENRNCKIFKEYEAGSERGYSFQSSTWKN